LLRHTNMKMDQVCQDKSGRLGGVAGSVVLYVIDLDFYSIYYELATKYFR
jgi:hypothetical protein